MLHLRLGIYGAAFLAERILAGMGGHHTAAADAWPLWLNAMVFGFFSAISLPIGAICGVIFSPVKQEVARLRCGLSPLCGHR